MLRSLVACCLLVATLSGCIAEEGPVAGDAPAAIPSGAPPSGEQAGTTASHAQPTRVESAVTVTNNGGSWVARKTVTLRNDFGGASAADVTLITDTGGVDASDWSQGGYDIVASLSGSGQTEAEARSNLGKMKVSHTDSLSNGRLTLRTEITGPGGGGLKARLPTQPSYRLTLEADTGGVSTEGLGGSVLTMTTDTGGVDATGAFNTATLRTDTGGIDVEGTYNTLRATADTGGIDARVKASASGTYTFEVDTGGIDVVLTGGSNHGYDVEASTNTGGIDLDIDDASDVGTQSRTHKHVKSDGYDGKAIRLKITAETGTGGVDVSG